MPPDRLDPRIKVVAAVAYVILVVATPVGSWNFFAIEAVLLTIVLMVARPDMWALIGRWLAYAPAALFLAAMVGFGHPQRSVLGWTGVAGSLAIKNALALLAVLTLGATTSEPRLLDALRGLGAPRILVATLHFMARYVHVLGDELSRMVQARRARSFRRRSGLDWGLLSGLIGVLLVRSMERGERVQAAMLARGFDGTIRSLDGPDEAPR